jgi:hypothetical protein
MPFSRHFGARDAVSRHDGDIGHLSGLADRRERVEQRVPCLRVHATKRRVVGALVCSLPDACSLNIPGCLDMALDQVSLENATSSGSCGDLLNATYGCPAGMCAGCNAADDPADYAACLSSARASVACGAYSNALGDASTCSVLEAAAAPAVDMCFPTTQSFTDVEYATFVSYFCGAADDG